MKKPAAEGSKPEQDSTPGEKRGMTVIEAAEALAVSRMAIYKWVDTGRIRVEDQGERRRARGMRVNSEDVEALRHEREAELQEKLGKVRSGRPQA